MTFDPNACVFKAYSPNGQGTVWAIGPGLFVGPSHFLETNGVGVPASSVSIQVGNAQYNGAQAIRFNPIQDGGGGETVSQAMGDFGLIYAPQIPNKTWLGYMPEWGGGACTVTGYPNGSYLTCQDVAVPLYSSLWRMTRTYNPGASGSPVLMYQDGVWQSAGVVVIIDGAASDAVRFTMEDVAHLEQWIYELTGEAPAVSRLYQSCLNRGPDPQGDTAWSQYFETLYQSYGGAIPSGQQIMCDHQDIVDGFLRSDEFSAKYGSVDSMSASTFVDLMYTNALNRAVDGSAQGWVDAINNGTPKAWVASAIGQAPEAIGRVSGLLGQQ